MKYALTADYHTHTIHSHGTGTIRDNVMAAREKGLKEIAITDHGPGNLEYGLRMDSVPEMRKMIRGLNQEFPDIRIYLGIEANIRSSENNLDITPEEIKAFDFVIAGYHYGVADSNDGKNFWDYNKGINRKSLMISNTDMALKAIYENNLRILTHPGFKAFFDMKELAKACAETDTLMEINVQHDGLSVKNIRICAESDAKFVISSDAHHARDVGKFQRGLEKAREAGLDLERIVNLKELESR